ncbi:MAG: glycosyltransferase [Coriobacteriia bacterium]
MSTNVATGRPSYNVIGFVTGNLGLGAAARNTVAALLEHGALVRVIDLELGNGRSGADTTYSHLADVRVGPGPVMNLFQLNPPEVVSLSEQWAKAVSVSKGFNVCVPFWELPRLPARWVEVLDCMDFVLAPTRYVQEACQRSLPPDRVLYYPQALTLPSGIVADRERWQLPAGTIAFLTCLDINSDVERKNTWATIDCFAEAFPSDRSVCLVVRVNGTPCTDVMRGQISRLRQRASRDQRIRVVEGLLTYRDVLCLYASCDVILSLHRSEGLGLLPMESMALGKPVILTGWSGPMDFADQESACLVPFELVPVKATQPDYAANVIGEHQVWAEPDRDIAVAFMRELAADVNLRAHLGERASRRIQQFNQHARESLPFAALEQELSSNVAFGDSHRAHARELSRLAHASRPSLVVRAKRTLVRALRATRLYPPGP